jgi:molybdenum cofactor biosynthesis enzyme MoaA
MYHYITTLEEIKTKVQAHLKNKLEIMLMLGHLEDKDVKEFNKWFQKHPYSIGIDKIMKFCQRKRMK